jgi:hypothetical protein
VPSNSSSPLQDGHSFVKLFFFILYSPSLRISLPLIRLSNEALFRLSHRFVIGKLGPDEQLSQSRHPLPRIFHLSYTRISILPQIEEFPVILYRIIIP